MSMFRVCVDKDESMEFPWDFIYLSVRQHICISYSGPLSAGGRRGLAKILLMCKRKSIISE